MKFLTDEKLTIIGAAGMIGSNIAQCCLMMRLTPDICLYDPYGPALEGVAEEMFHCSFPDSRITFTTDIRQALKGTSYLISSGGAARKADMTREDLLKGNAEIAARLGKDIRKYCPDVKQVVIIFNPADITGLVTLLHAGIKPSRLSTLAALDSTRLQSELARHFDIPQSQVINSRTYGGHGEQMAVFASTTTLNGKKLAELIGTPALTQEEWKQLQRKVVQGGKHIIDLRGRSSFQSPAYLSAEMMRAAMGGEPFCWPAGTYVSNGKFNHIMMAMETSITPGGISYQEVKGTPAEEAALEKSYEHLCRLRDEVIGMGIIPPIDQWTALNAHLK